MSMLGGIRLQQNGMVLLISLVFLLLLSQIGLSSIQGAVTQQKVASSLWQRNQSFQSAESGLRQGESVVQRGGPGMPVCHSVMTCAPPNEAFSLTGAGTNPVSAITWLALRGGLYGVQSLGEGAGLAHLPLDTRAALFRITAVGLAGQSRTVLEAVYARVEEGGSVKFRRISWRQLQ
ncbi:pilus assembly protein PilX [Pseudomonas paralactis]|uniref:pilus assembly PilX family protein n=1 Tax=Pseudomonas paralactis TaxID=1615673 RepID=UPI00164423A1|nr:PilX N-terminal domain-containing pilus assembly protein [Pseudomonas paralactis]MBC3254956.1 pilus assembly protein PilX [Pseudomonas paralactis]